MRDVYDVYEDLENTQRLPLLVLETEQTSEPEHLAHDATESQLFEVCGALKETLLRVLTECKTRRLPLKCGTAAARSLENCCERLEQILCDPGFSASMQQRKERMHVACEALLRPLPTQIPQLM